VDDWQKRFDSRESMVRGMPSAADSLDWRRKISVIKRRSVMKSVKMILVCALIGFALFVYAGCASMGTGHKTAQILQKDQGSSIQDANSFVNDLKY